MSFYEVFKDRLSSHLSEIDDLKAKVEHMESQAGDIVMKALDDAPSPEVAWGILHLVYWHFPQISVELIASRLGVKRQKLCVALGPVEATTCCRDCGDAMEIVVTSRTNLNAVRKGDWYAAKDEQKYCPTCLEARAKSQAARHEHYEREKAERLVRINGLRAMPYAEYLKTDHWQDVRRRALKRSGFKCQLCNRDNNGLHVHHRTYVNRGNEQNSDVIVLCADCHQEFHERMEVQS